MDAFDRLKQLYDQERIPEDLRGETINARAIKKLEAAAGAPLPEAWRRLLKVVGDRGWVAGLWANGEPEGVFPVTDYYQGDDSAHLDGLIVVGDSDEGDYWCLEIRPTKGTGTAKPSEDARLVRVSHETMEITEDYPSVTAFVEKFVTSVKRPGSKP